MEKKPYETPKVFELGRVLDLTQHKCNGSSDLAYPQDLEPDIEQPTCI